MRQGSEPGERVLAALTQVLADLGQHSSTVPECERQPPPELDHIRVAVDHPRTTPFTAVANESQSRRRESTT